MRDIGRVILTGLLCLSLDVSTVQGQTIHYTRPASDESYENKERSRGRRDEPDSVLGRILGAEDPVSSANEEDKQFLADIEGVYYFAQDNATDVSAIEIEEGQLLFARAIFRDQDSYITVLGGELEKVDETIYQLKPYSNWLEASFYEHDAYYNYYHELLNQVGKNKSTYTSDELAFANYVRDQVFQVHPDHILYRVEGAEAAEWIETFEGQALHTDLLEILQLMVPVAGYYLTDYPVEHWSSGDYGGYFIFEDDAVQLASMEEGRVYLHNRLNRVNDNFFELHSVDRIFY